MDPHMISTGPRDCATGETGSRPFSHPIRARQGLAPTLGMNSCVVCAWIAQRARQGLAPTPGMNSCGCVALRPTHWVISNVPLNT